MALSRGCSDKKTWSTCRSAPIVVSIYLALRAQFAAVLEIATHETKAATDKGMETTLRHMREMTKNAEHEMHAIVLSCKRARKRCLRHSQQRA